MRKKNILASILTGVQDSIEPILLRSIDPMKFIRMLHNMGWDSKAIFGNTIIDIHGSLIELMSIIGSQKTVELKTKEDF